MDLDKLQKLLDEQIDWPDYYTFKFIVKSEQKDQVLALLSDHDVAERPSKAGNYVSITSKKRFSSAAEVISVYEQMRAIEGIISL